MEVFQFSRTVHFDFARVLTELVKFYDAHHAYICLVG